MCNINISENVQPMLNSICINSFAFVLIMYVEIILE